jgi:hypothetical protein
VIPSANFNEALEIRAKGTGEWFIRSKVFVEWIDTADSIVWIYGKRKPTKLAASARLLMFGIAGCGKTVLR